MLEVLKQNFSSIFNKKITGQENIYSLMKSTFLNAEISQSKVSSLQAKNYELQEELRKTKALNQYYPKEKSSIIPETSKNESVSSSLVSDNLTSGCDNSIEGFKNSSSELMSKNISNLKGYMESKDIDSDVSQYIYYILDLMKSEVEYISLQADQMHKSMNQAKQKMEGCKIKMLSYRSKYKLAKRELSKLRNNFEFVNKLLQQQRLSSGSPRRREKERMRKLEDESVKKEEEITKLKNEIARMKLISSPIKSDNTHQFGKFIRDSFKVRRPLLIPNCRSPR